MGCRTSSKRRHFRGGDYVRISVESPRTGYLYVIDREFSADGSTGEPMLIFPWAEADNKLVPGNLIDIPGQEDDPNHFTARVTSRNQDGELQTIYRVMAPDRKGMLVNLLLKYGK